MNRNIILALLLVITIIVVLVSYAVEKSAAKKGEYLLNKINSENEKALLEVSSRYMAKGDSLKARKTLNELLAKSTDPKNSTKIKKDIEDLNMKILLSTFPDDGSVNYEVKSGDSLGKIASKFKTTVELIKKTNGLTTDVIMPGKILKAYNTPFSILVDRSENILILKKADGETVKTYVVSTGENLSTPIGEFVIEEKLISPIWYKVGAVVDPASPDYELGTRWMGLSKAGYGLHGTKDDSSVGKHITKGCVRMKNTDVEELYTIVPGGTKVTIIE